MWPLLAAAGVMTLAGCGPDGQPGLIAGQARGATIAFESIDGMPRPKFQKLVDDLNQEAQTRRLAVASRETPSAYRVRGYLSAETAKGTTKISWVWDVFDTEQRRVLRITGAETIKSPTLGRHPDAWTVADDAMLQRIARRSMDELAAFLTSSAPGAMAQAQASRTDVALIGDRDPSPEAAGIFRIPRSQSDPVIDPAASER
jgi:hypothetical protein